MNKKLLYLWLILLLFLSNCYFGPDEVDTKPLPKRTGKASLANVDFIFTFNQHDLEFTNQNIEVVKVQLFNKTTNATLVNELITFPLNTNSFDSLDFEDGDLVEFKVWQGMISVWYGYVHGFDPDFDGVGILAEGTIDITEITNKVSYEILLETINGANCQFNGRYLIANPADQSNNTFFCQNISSDPIRVELFVLQPRIGGGYQSKFQLASFWIAFQDAKDITAVSYDYGAYEPLAIRVTSYDPFNTSQQKKREAKGIYLSVGANNYTPIYNTIYLP